MTDTSCPTSPETKQEPPVDAGVLGKKYSRGENQTGSQYPKDDPTGNSNFGLPFKRLLDSFGVQPLSISFKAITEQAIDNTKPFDNNSSPPCPPKSAGRDLTS